MHPICAYAYIILSNETYNPNDLTKYNHDTFMLLLTYIHGENDTARKETVNIAIYPPPKGL